MITARFQHTVTTAVTFDPVVTGEALVALFVADGWHKGAVQPETETMHTMVTMRHADREHGVCSPIPDENIDFDFIEAAEVLSGERTPLDIALACGATVVAEPMPPRLATLADVDTIAETVVRIMHGPDCVTPTRLYERVTALLDVDDGGPAPVQFDDSSHDQLERRAAVEIATLMGIAVPA